jgi:hypothetical protein
VGLVRGSDIACGASCDRDRTVAALMLEREWQSQVTEAARTLGWRVYHTHDSRRSEPGWPDLALVRDRLIMAELKTEAGRLSESQRTWIDSLANAGVEVYVWRPSDVNHVLRTLSTRGRA